MSPTQSAAAKPRSAAPGSCAPKGPKHISPGQSAAAKPPAPHWVTSSSRVRRPERAKPSLSAWEGVELNDGYYGH